MKLVCAFGGGGGRFAAYVNNNGNINDDNDYDNVNNDNNGVRPCVRVRIDPENVKYCLSRHTGIRGKTNREPCRTKRCGRIQPTPPRTGSFSQRTRVGFF
ncbi:MAG: hypothetical protein LBT55_05190 [Clostridiaceae bacterium]|nr:hypothetical protein [Clostridiaceae bacterium]